MNLRLPDISPEKAVIFHVQFLESSSDLILQIPPREKGKPSNTFRVDLQNAGHHSWVVALKNGRQLLDKLHLYGHVAYIPATGEMRVLQDKEYQEPSTIQLALQEAEEQKVDENPLIGKWDGLRRVKHVRVGPFGV